MLMRNDIHVKSLPQRRLCLLFFVCCLTLLLAGSGLAGAAELPEREALQTRLEEAMSAQSDTPSDTAQREVEALKAALDGLEKLAQVERQRRCLAHALGVHRHDLRIACRANAIRGLLGHRLLKAATRCIRAAFGRYPARGEGLAGMG